MDKLHYLGILNRQTCKPPKTALIFLRLASSFAFATSQSFLNYKYFKKKLDENSNLLIRKLVKSMHYRKNLFETTNVLVKK